MVSEILRERDHVRLFSRRLRCFPSGSYSLPLRFWPLLWDSCIGHDRRPYRAYDFGSDYWALGAMFAILAVAYYWSPVVLSLNLGHFASRLHIWLSFVSAFAFLLRLPSWQAFTTLRPTLLSTDRGSFLVLWGAGRHHRYAMSFLRSSVCVRLAISALRHSALNVRLRRDRLAG